MTTMQGWNSFGPPQEGRLRIVPPEKIWRPYFDQFTGISYHPPVEAWYMRAQWSQPVRMKWEDIHPLMNVAGLYWCAADEPPKWPPKASRGGE